MRSVAVRAPRLCAVMWNNAAKHYKSNSKDNIRAVPGCRGRITRTKRCPYGVIVHTVPNLDVYVRLRRRPWRTPARHTGASPRLCLTYTGEQRWAASSSLPCPQACWLPEALFTLFETHLHDQQSQTFSSTPLLPSAPYGFWTGCASQPRTICADMLRCRCKCVR